VVHKDRLLVDLKYEGVAAIADRNDTGKGRIGRLCSSGVTVLLLILENG